MMRLREPWLELVDLLLLPRRTSASAFESAREELLATRRRSAEGRARALAACERRIEAARAIVFAANDGVIGAHMTDLERQWRILSRPDADAGMMDLWARIAPPPWLDRKRWRDSAPEARVDAAIALASDPDGVERAEAAALELRRVLEPWGVTLPARLRWRAFEADAPLVAALFDAPLRAAEAALEASDLRRSARERAIAIRDEVRARVLARLPERPLLGGEVSHAAFVDVVWRAARPEPSPVAPLADLWRSGYRLAAIDAAVTLELPPL